MKVLKCGHLPNAKKDGKPCCVMCNCSEFAKDVPNLTNRKARCSDCGKIVDSKLNLAFFIHKPNEQYDKFYCGCCGWD